MMKMTSKSGGVQVTAQGWKGGGWEIGVAGEGTFVHAGMIDQQGLITLDSKDGVWTAEEVGFVADVARMQEVATILIRDGWKAGAEGEILTFTKCIIDNRKSEIRIHDLGEVYSYGTFGTCEKHETLRAAARALAVVGL